MNYPEIKSKHLITSVEDYIKEYLNIAGMFYKNKELFVYTVIEGLFDWKGEEYFWSPCYEGNKVSFFIRDYSFDTNLKSQEEVEALINRYFNYSVYSIPNRDKYFEKDYFKITSTNDDLCSRGSLTFQEKEELIKRMSEKDKNLYFENIRKAKAGGATEWLKTTVSKENPIRFHMEGMDDTSYGSVFASVEEALRVLEEIVSNPVEETVLNNGFLFTN